MKLAVAVFGGTLYSACKLTLAYVLQTLAEPGTRPLALILLAIGGPWGTAQHGIALTVRLGIVVIAIDGILLLLIVIRFQQVAPGGPLPELQTVQDFPALDGPHSALLLTPGTRVEEAVIGGTVETAGPFRGVTVALETQAAALDGPVLSLTQPLALPGFALALFLETA